MKLYEIYFSPTGGTKKVSDCISHPWNCEKIQIDLSDPNLDFTRFEIEQEDICVVAVPSYGGRVPITAVDRLYQLAGDGASTILVAVYGNRAYEDTLLELKEILSENGFFCVAAIAAVAKHSIFPKFGSNRPDKTDLRELLDYADRIKDTIDKNNLTENLYVPGGFPFKKNKGVSLIPKVKNSCTKCGVCADLCPVGAISKDDPTKTNRNLCISCMKCVSVCKNHARNLNKMALSVAYQKMKKTCSDRKPNELYL